MIKYSTQPSNDAKVLTDSPTSPIVTTKDVKGLNDINDQQQDTKNLQDLDAQDNNE